MTLNPSDAFTYKALTILPTDRNPDFNDITLLKEQIYANATTSFSNRGGPYGHLALCFSPAEYLQLPGAVAWVNPVHPGNAPVHLQGATAPQITEANRAYLAAQDEYSLFLATESALRNCLIEAIPYDYIARLRHRTLGFATITPRAILAHVTQQYGLVVPDDLTINERTLVLPWDPADPIEALWTQLEHCQAFGDANNGPIPDERLTRVAITILDNTGVFTQELREWRRKPADQQTRANLYLDFDAANKARQRSLTSGTAGYANAATQSKTKTTAANKTPPNDTVTGVYYCWSHGISKNPKHTSATCNNKFVNHCSDATIWDTKGGNRFVQTKPGLVQVWKMKPRFDRANHAATTPAPVVPDDITTATGVSSATGFSASAAGFSA